MYVDDYDYTIENHSEPLSFLRGWSFASSVIKASFIYIKTYNNNFL